MLPLYDDHPAHTVQQWQRLDELVEAAAGYWAALPRGRRDFDLAKAMFMALAAQIL